MPTGVTADYVIRELGKILAARCQIIGGAPTGSCTFTVGRNVKCVPDITQDDCAQISAGTGDWREGQPCKGFPPSGGKSIPADDAIGALGEAVAAWNRAAGLTVGFCTLTVDGKVICIPDMTKDDSDQISADTGTWVEAEPCLGRS
jgi:hypothetical protein